MELGAKGAGLSNVVAIAAGGSHSLALKSDGSVVGWGSTFAGEALVPPGLCNVVAIAAGGEASLALSAGPQLSSITLNGPSPVLRFHTFLGQSYSVDYSPNLNPGSWLELPGSPIAGDGREAVLTDTNATSGAASRFYRLRQP